MTLIEKSLQIAVRAHEGQHDKGRAEYIHHPLRLMRNMSTEQEMAVALLHDVVEDSKYTLDDLKSEGIPAVVIAAVECLTNREGEDFERFVERVAVNPLARKVKIADLEDNMDIKRLPGLGDADCERLKKYHKAWRYLKTLQ